MSLREPITEETLSAMQRYIEAQRQAAIATLGTKYLCHPNNRIQKRGERNGSGMVRNGSTSRTV